MSERETGFCRNGAMHYCPNCANTFKAAPSPEPPRPQEPPAPLRALEQHEQELRTQAGIFSRRNWGVLNEQGNVEVMPGLLDVLSVRLEQAADAIRAALRVDPAPQRGEPGEQP
jgi:hypothetical protein